MTKETGPRPNSHFLKVKCPDCSSEQVVFDRASSLVTCLMCSATIAKPTGGKANIRGDIAGVLE